VTHRRRLIPRTSVLVGSVLLLSQVLGVRAAPQLTTEGFATGLVPAAPTAAVALGTVKVVAAAYRGDVRDLPEVPSKPRPAFDRVEPNDTKTGAAVPGPQAPVVPLAPMPAPSQNFAGLSNGDGMIPPDPNGDVGPNNYIQAVNTSYAIYGKTGTLQDSFTEDSLFSTSGSNPCNGNSQGDPVVLYDTIADRWILSHFAFAVDGGGVPVAPFYQCIAASMTGDPVAGGWWLYAVRTDLGTPGAPPAGTLNDYGKFGLWTDCVYFAANGFTYPAGTFAGTEFASFSRSDMYAGEDLTGAIGFIAGGPFTMIPSNLRAPSAEALPPAGTLNYFVSESRTAFAFEVRKFTPATNCGVGGTLSAPTNVSQTSYAWQDDGPVPQPNTTTRLDTLYEQIMQKVQYRKVGSSESLWVVHSVRPTAGSTVRPQWAQLDVTGGAVATTSVQQQIYAPDTTLNRWMGSIAADKDGNVALGYSTSNGTSPNFPSIAYTGRLATDPLNTMPQTEIQLVAGAGSQTNSCPYSSCDRWGDYTAMTVDPVDDCTFWYTNQYYSSQANGTSGNWQTRIGSFKFPACGAAPTVTSITPANGPAAGGTTVTITGTGFSGATAVDFGATAAASFTVSSGTQISAVSPAGTGTVDVTVTGPSGTSATSSADQFTYLPDMAGATYFSLPPTRLLDTRSGNGLSDPFTKGVARTFQVTGRGEVPANAIGVTGNLTVTQHTSDGYVSLTPVPTNTPTTSTLNFPIGGDWANGVTVPLGGTGTLSATYVTGGPGHTTHLVFDVTGYFVPE